MGSVKLEQLTRQFDDGTRGVDRVNLDVADHEFLVLVGPSGCGKTTILRLIAGLDTPDEGRIYIDGDDVTDLAPRDRDVAMVFQNYALYPHMSVQDNIAFPLAMRRVAPAERTRRVRDVAESLGIGDYLTRRPAELSGGQRQRVALARAIVREPRVFLFDEPLSNLDAQVRSMTRAELVRLHRTLGATIIHVTHDQVEAMSMAQRVAVMQKGRIEHCAPPMDVYRSPGTLFTATFLGSPSINQWRGEVRSYERGSGTGTLQKFRGTVSLGVHMMPDTDVVLAVRPEHLRFDVVESGGDATITRVEALGAETLIHATTAADEHLCSRIVSGSAPVVGSKVRCTIEAAHALLFDREGRLAGRGRA